MDVRTEHPLASGVPGAVQTGLTTRVTLPPRTAVHAIKAALLLHLGPDGVH